MESWNNDSQFFTFIENNILDELAGALVLVALILIAFSKEKYEDEFIGQLRLQSLVWATYTNYIILFIAILFIYDILFYWVLVFNMFTLLIFFVIHFNITMAKTKNQITDEE